MTQTTHDKADFLSDRISRMTSLAAELLQLDRELDSSGLRAAVQKLDPGFEAMHAVLETIDGGTRVLSSAPNSKTVELAHEVGVPFSLKSGREVTLLRVADRNGGADLIFSLRYDEVTLDERRELLSEHTTRTIP